MVAPRPRGRPLSGDPSGPSSQGRDAAPARLRLLGASPYVHLGLVALFWAGNIIFARAVHEQIAPLTLSFWRWGVSSLIIVPLAAPRLWVARRVILLEWKFFCVMGLMGIALFHSLLYVALNLTFAMNVSIISSVTPIGIVLISWVWIGERLSPRQALGVVVSLVGVLAIITRGHLGALLALQLNAGDLWALATVPMWGVYTVLLRRHQTGLDAWTTLAVIIAVGTVMLLPLFVRDIVVGAATVYNAATVGTILFVSVFGSVISYWLWNRSVALIGANKAGLFLHLIPVFVAVLAISFLSERAMLYHGVGIAMIFTGIFLVTARQAKA